MHTKIVIIYFLLSCCLICDGADENVVESRGKKKKLALLVFWADVVLKKVFILKLVYAFIFWVIVHKAGYLLTWFINYTKEKKHEHHDHDYPEHGHFERDPHYSYGPPHDYEPYGAYGPYRKVYG